MSQETHSDYCKDEDLAVTIDSLISMGAKIIKTELINDDTWEIEYKL